MTSHENEILKADPVAFITNTVNKDKKYMYIPSGDPVFNPNTTNKAINMFTYVELGKYISTIPPEKSMDPYTGIMHEISPTTYKFEKLPNPLPFEKLSTMKLLVEADTKKFFNIEDPSARAIPIQVMATGTPIQVRAIGREIPANTIPGKINVVPVSVSSIATGRVVSPSNVVTPRYGSGGKKTNKRKTNKRKTNKRKTNKRKTNKRKTNKK
jgi:hypothetical protein